MPLFKCVNNLTPITEWLTSDQQTHVGAFMHQELGGLIREEEALQLLMRLLLLYQATTMPHQDVKLLLLKISQLVSIEYQAEELKQNQQKPAEFTFTLKFLIGAYRPDLYLGITLFPTLRC